MSETHRILVADDDPTIRRLLELNFQFGGYAVEVAANGDEALEKARALMPDVILLDVMMPGLNGWEVCRRLKEDEVTRALPVIFLSARAQEEDRRRGLALGVFEYVVKPFDNDRLLEVVGKALAGTRPA